MFVLVVGGIEDEKITSAYDPLVVDFFVAGGDDDRVGALVAITNADGDGLSDMAVGSGAGRPARVRVYPAGSLTGGGEPAGFTDLTPFGGAILTDGVYVG